MRYGLLATLLFLGCGGSKSASSSPPPPPPPANGSGALADSSRDACANAISEAAKTGKGDEVFSPEDEKFSVEIQAVMTETCVATKWPQMIILCLTNGTTREELNSCTEMLTDAQRHDMMERVLVVTKKHEAAAKPGVKPVP